MKKQKVQSQPKQTKNKKKIDFQSGGEACGSKTTFSRSERIVKTRRAEDHEYYWVNRRFTFLVPLFEFHLEKTLSF